MSQTERPAPPICPIMSRTVAVETMRITDSESGSERPSVVSLFQPCIGSKCAAWIEYFKVIRPGTSESTGKGSCGMVPAGHGGMIFPDPANQEGQS